MPNLNAGELIRAMDWPPAVMSQDSTQINNPASSTYTEGTPAVNVTFTAPTSGRVLLIVGGGLGNGALVGADRIFLSPEVRENNVSGALVLSATVTERGYGSQNAAVAFHYGSRESVLDGLTPGGVYFARVMYSVATGDAGASTQDIAVREIIVAPIP